MWTSHSPGKAHGRICKLRSTILSSDMGLSMNKIPTLRADLPCLPRTRHKKVDHRHHWPCNMHFLRSFQSVRQPAIFGWGEIRMRVHSHSPMLQRLYFVRLPSADRETFCPLAAVHYASP